MKRRYNVVLFVACCVLALVSVQLAQAQDGQLTWTQNLSNGGRVYAMAINPSNPAIIYSAGLDSGVYKTTNAGVSWFAVNTGLTYRNVQALAISRSNPNVLYAGTDHLGGVNKGVYVTTNAGASWTLTGSALADSGIQGLAVDPSDPNVAYAAVFDGVVPNPINGLYKTTNAGATWFADTAGLGLNRRFLCVEVNPFNRNTVYAGTSFMTAPATPSKIYKSVNGGNTWTEITNGLPQLTTNVDPVRAFSISTSDTNVVLAALFVNDTAGGAFLTTNGGALWVKKHNGLPAVAGTLLRSCLIRPGSSREFFVGLDGGGATSRGVWRTINGGDNWSDFNGGTMLNSHSVRALVAKTQVESTLYAGNATASPATARGVHEYSWPTHDLGVSALQRITTLDNSGGGGDLAMDNPPSDRITLTVVADGPFAALADTVRFRAIVRDYGSIPESTYQVRWSVDGVVQATLNNTRPVVVAGTDTFLFQWNAGTPGAHTARAWTLLATDADRSNDTASNSFTITPPSGACDTLRNLGTIPAYPSGAFGHASATLGDTLYIVGGSSTGTASTTVATYHIPTGTWGTGRPMLEAKSGGDLVASGGNLYYIGGGSAVNVSTPGCYGYNPVTGWSAIANIPSPVNGNVAESWGDSVIFCMSGGWTTYLTTIQVYRPASNTWSTSTALPAGRGRRSFAGGLWAGKLFVAGGFSGVFRKDFLIGTIIRADSIVWTVGPDVPMRPGATGSSRPGGHAVDGRFYFVAGETSPAPATQDSIFLWDINAGSWLSTIIRGRGTLAASNYWGVVSSSLIGGNLKVWIPGGILGTAFPGLFVIDACRSTPPPTPGWTARTSGTTSFLQSVRQVNANVIWAAGNGATVRRSTDGGTTWTNGNPNPGIITGDIYNIEARDANNAWCTTSPGGTRIYRTTDGGTT
ncbi:MAG: hypothetical protein HW412_1259, partial [Bacteroidetes bacterium]|nr:hypothetical protein [Bacteroidota bacterium]